MKQRTRRRREREREREERERERERSEVTTFSLWSEGHTGQFCVLRRIKP